MKAHSVLFSGAPEITNNWAVGNHNANHQQVDHGPDAATQLQSGQGLCVYLAGHIDIRDSHAKYGELAEHQWPG